MTSEAGRRLRLLFVLPFAPRLDGVHGGAKVTGQLIAGLAKRHDVCVLHLSERGEPGADPELVKACDLVEAVGLRGMPTTMASRLALRLSPVHGIPIWVAEVAEPRFAARLRELAASWRPDVVQLELPVMGQYLTSLDGSPAVRVLVDHDPYAPGLRTWPGALGGVTRAVDKLAWARFERRVIEQVDSVVVFTDWDRRAVEKSAPRARIAQVPLGARLSDAPLDPVGARPPTVLFVGNFTHPPNRDAALWLGERLFPPLRGAHPDARLVIVGPDPPPSVRALASDAIEVTGEVADLTPYLNAAAVVVAPIRVGGGMRVKVLEALDAGKAIVATPLATEGLEVTDGEQLRIAADEAEFRDRVSELLGDEPARREQAGRARRWAEANLGWAHTIARYEALYRELVEERA